MVTGLIAYRAWVHYRSSSLVRIRVGRDRSLSLLLLLVESGAVYCAVWIVGIVFWSLPNVGDPFDIFVAMLPQMTAMYPTVIVALCALQRSYTDTITNASSDLLPTAARFPSTPAGQPGSRIQYPSSARVVDIAFPSSTNGRSFSSGSSVSSILHVDDNFDPEKTLPPLPESSHLSMQAAAVLL
ncbi:hypothetical protein FA95DRAFT_354363 [Auriscalpium vulgare]|uniref:Uncharacterized protein n=1 Tax=Auriscalpium vulgare TaxID=40419 RepID=A0ACB8S4C9_9AGAM|nr:hypothetical protein FA95DRAFT_354363 [Auriscalpium vulgare]